MTSIAGVPYDRLAVTHVDPAKIDLAWELHCRFPPDPAHDPIAQVILSGRSQIVRAVSEELLREITVNEEHFQIANELGLVSWMVVALPGRRGQRETI